MSSTVAQRTLQRACSERELMDAIVEYAERHGWRVWHDNDSRRNAAGLPDLILMREGELLWAELKTERGRVRPEQMDWLRELAEAGEEVYVWRPSEWFDGTIERRLA